MQIEAHGRLSSGSSKKPIDALVLVSHISFDLMQVNPYGNPAIIKQILFEIHDRLGAFLIAFEAKNWVGAVHAGEFLVLCIYIE